MENNSEDENTNIIINSVKDTIKSPLIWNKLVKSIQHSNIDMEKLINDSIEYGIDVGLFQQGKGGKIVPLDVLNNNNTVNNEKSIKFPKQPQNSNIKHRSVSISESGSLSCESNALSSTVQTRRSMTLNNDLKRPQPLSDSVNKPKRRKSEINGRLKALSKPMARPVPICAYCLGDELINKRTERQEDMISCWDCGTCAHPSCLRWPENLIDKVRTIRWQCLQCKRCSYCGNVSKKDDDMLLCDACDRGFHMYCFSPPIKSPPKGEWICRTCRPLNTRKEESIYPLIEEEDILHHPNCQMITSENSKILSKPSTQKKTVKKTVVKSTKVGKTFIKSRAKKVKSNNIKMNLLHMKKKKLLDRAVMRQRSSLTDGLSMFFTPSNKRQSRVSKQSLKTDIVNDNNNNNIDNNSNNNNDNNEIPVEQTSQTSVSTIKERSYVGSVVSRIRSNSPVIHRERLIYVKPKTIERVYDVPGKKQIIYKGYLFGKHGEMAKDVLCYDCVLRWKKINGISSCRTKLKVKDGIVIGCANSHTHEPQYNTEEVPQKLKRLKQTVNVQKLTLQNIRRQIHRARQAVGVPPSTNNNNSNNEDNNNIGDDNNIGVKDTSLKEEGSSVAPNATEKVLFIRGTSQIIHNGFIYGKHHNLSNGAIGYVCSKRRSNRSGTNICSARINVKNGLVVGAMHKHTHPPPDDISNRIVDTEEAPQSILGNEMQQLRQKVSIQKITLRNIRRQIQRARLAVHTMPLSTAYSGVIGATIDKKMLVKGNGSVAGASITESSSMTMSKIDQSTSQSVMSIENPENDPYPISDLDRQWYAEIQEKVAELLPPPMDAPPQLHSLNKTSRYRPEHSEPPELLMEGSKTHDSLADQATPSSDNISQANQKFPPRIQIGQYIIDTWYSAPYPSEYARLNVLYICEYCLRHIKSYDVYVMHMKKCTQYFPPGNEIYRNGELSVFEVDGYVSKLYCQQLCLLAKLFLDHKTLYYDVEPFLFYVAVVARNDSCHIIGYFSKEKRSTHKYNLSCIMVLPPYQKFNYGRFLIDFSYLLSRKEGESGSPEKPLSTLGRLSYESYWKSKVIPYLLNRDDVTGEFYRHSRFSRPPKGLSITIDKISSETGINPHDVAGTIQMLSKTVDLDEADRITIQLDWDKIKLETEKYANRYPKWVPLESECLRWAPLILSNGTVTCQLPHVSTKLNKEIPEKTSNETESNKPISSPKSPKSPKFSNKKVRKSSSSEPKVVQESHVSDETSIAPIISEIKEIELCNIADKDKGEKEEEAADNVKVVKSSPLKVKLPKTKKEVNTRTVVTRNKSARQEHSDERHMVTRNKSIIKNVISNPIIEISPMNLDLTYSEVSDNTDNDDCVVVLDPLPPQNIDWRKGKPILEKFHDALTCIDDTESSSKTSPPINEPSPVSVVQKSIVCPTLISPEIDLEEETEADFILSMGRRPLIILEKCDEKPFAYDLADIDLIEISEEVLADKDVEVKTVAAPFIDLGCREMDIVVSESDSKSNTPGNVSLDESQTSEQEINKNTNSSEIVEFTLPLSLNQISQAEESAPILSRVPSQDSNSNGLQLPSDFSMNEEFKMFYNDGNVFNSITPSHTGSSDKDAEDSLLSVSNSDIEINGTYSCDSSITFLNKPAQVTASKVCDIVSEDHICCSPCQSDIVQSQVSSTTPFVIPSTVWNVSVRSSLTEDDCLSTVPVLRCDDDAVNVGDIGVDKEAGERVEEGSVVVSSSLRTLEEGGGAVL